jgi:hypothetical protein
MLGEEDNSMAETNRGMGISPMSDHGPDTTSI